MNELYAIYIRTVKNARKQFLLKPKNAKSVTTKIFEYNKSLIFNRPFEYIKVDQNMPIMYYHKHLHEIKFDKKLEMARISWSKKIRNLIIVKQPAREKF